MATTRRRRVGRGRYLIRPCGLAGTRWEPAAAGLYSVALGTVAGLELLTPDDTLAALGLPPLLAATWTLSRGFATMVSAVALALFTLIVAMEARSRMSILSIGVAALLIAAAARLYAARLAGLLAARAKQRPAGAIVPTSDDVEIWLSGLEALTPREAEVARLASQGYMASEIGGRLQISERTVESHLAHVYAKLGVNSRRALIRMSTQLAGQQR